MTDTTDHPAAPWPDGAPLRPEQLLEHVDWVRRLAARLVRDEHTAEDLAQRTLASALRRPPAMARGSIRGWLTRVLTNEARSEHRGRSRRLEREEMVARQRGAMTEDPADIDRRFDLQRSLFAAVDRLEEPQRRVVVLRYFEDLPPREIAERLGEPLRTIETRLHRARAKLRQLLDAEFGTRGTWAALVVPIALKPAAMVAGGALVPSAPASSLTVTSPIVAGIALMSAKNVLIAAAFVGAVLLGVRLMSGVDRQLDPEDTTVGSVDNTVVVPASIDVESAPDVTVPVATGEARIAAGSVEVASDPDGVTAVPSGPPVCTVRGTVLDAAGDPLIGVRVQLRAHKVWREGVDVPRIDGEGLVVGFVTRTDDAGAFSIDAPVPTVGTVTLLIVPDPFHEAAHRRFGTGRRMEVPLDEGVRDIGTLRLAATGAIFGHVTDRDGVPVEGVRIFIGATVRSSFAGGIRTDAMGEYFVAHAPPGEYGVEASPERHLHVSSTLQVIEAGATTGPVDFVLDDAPTITGVVLDDRGAPVANARVNGVPLGSGGGASTRSGSDGRFTLYLPAEASYEVSATLEGYVTWGSGRDGTSVFRAGTSGLEITLMRIESVRFVVVDAASGAPIESFALEILEGKGTGSVSYMSRASRPSPIVDRPDGIAQAAARQTLDKYVVFADGYLQEGGDVAFDRERERVQTVRLRRGLSVTGRVVRAGAAVAAASVEIVRGYDTTMRGFQIEDTSDITQFRVMRSSRIVARSGEDGRFQLAGLRSGNYRLRVVSNEGGRADLYPVRVTAQDVDLGDIEALPCGSIIGEVLVPAGADAAGIPVYLDDMLKEIVTSTDTEGRFEFTSVGAGQHSVHTGARKGSMEGTDSVPVAVVSGEESLLTIDARDRAMTDVELTVLVNGQPATGVRITIFSGEIGTAEQEDLGRCDEAGRVLGSVRAWGDARVLAGLPWTTYMVHPTARLELVAGDPTVATIRYEFASVVLHFPDDVEFPANGSFVVVIPPRAGGEFVIVKIKMLNGRPSPEFDGLVDLDGRTLTVNLLPPGRYSATVSLEDDRTKATGVAIGEGHYRPGRVPYFERKIDIDARLGETLTIDL